MNLSQRQLLPGPEVLMIEPPSEASRDVAFVGRFVVASDAGKIMIDGVYVTDHKHVTDQLVPQDEGHTARDLDCRKDSQWVHSGILGDSIAVVPSAESFAVPHELDSSRSNAGDRTAADDLFLSRLEFTSDEDYDIAHARNRWVEEAAHRQRRLRLGGKAAKKLEAASVTFFDVLEAQYRPRLEENSVSEETLEYAMDRLREQEAIKITADIAARSEQLSRSKYGYVRRFMNNWAKSAGGEFLGPQHSRHAARVRAGFFAASAFFISRYSYKAAEWLHDTKEGAKAPLSLAAGIISGMWWSAVAIKVARGLAAGETNVRRTQAHTTRAHSDRDHNVTVAELRSVKMREGIAEVTNSRGAGVADRYAYAKPVNEVVAETVRENQRRVAAAFLMGIMVGVSYGTGAQVVDEQWG